MLKNTLLSVLLIVAVVAGGLAVIQAVLPQPKAHCAKCKVKPAPGAKPANSATLPASAP
jgi:hypothetical protein